MEKQLESLHEIYLLSHFKAKHSFEFDFITSESICLVDCDYALRGNTIHFDYQLADLFKLDKLDYTHSLQFLLNMVVFMDYYNQFEVNFDLDNLYYDYNYIPKFLKRDIAYHKLDYLQQIQYLAFYLIDEKHDYHYYQNSGFLISYKSKLLEKIKEVESIVELKQCLKKALYDKVSFKK